MSVTLLLKDSSTAEQRLVPVAAQDAFGSSWLPGIVALGLDWTEMMETGFDITAKNRNSVLAELARLRSWMVEQQQHPAVIERLDGLVKELFNLRFDAGATAFLG